MRQTKSPRTRAEDALAVANRKVKRLETKQASLTGDLKAVEHELEAEKKRRDYAAASPDLPAKDQPVKDPTK